MGPRSVLLCWLCMQLVKGATIKRSTVQTPPCFFNESLDLQNGKSFLDRLRDVNIEIQDLKARADNFRNSMADYCVVESDVNGEQFIDVNTSDVDDERQKFEQNFCVNKTTFLDEMAVHYNTLNLLAYYLEKLYGTAPLTAKGNLIQFQDNVYVCMCSKKIALLSQDQAPLETVPGGNMSDVFIQLHMDSETRCDQERLEYIVALDSQRLLNYLMVLYSSFKETSSFSCD